MTLQQLKYIVALDNYRHFVKAAEHCLVNQSTLTIQVKKLEDEIGIKLFDRTHTPLVVTPHGEKVVDKARMILREVEEMKELVSIEKNSIQGSFKIGIIPTISPYIIPEFSGGFVQNYPRAELIIDELESETIINDLKKGKIDIGILVTPLNEKSLREIKLYHEPFIFYGNKKNPLVKQNSIKTSELEGLEDLWLLKNGHCFKSQVLNICDSPKTSNGLKFQSGSIETLKRMVQNYGGYTLVPEMSLNEMDHSNSCPFVQPKPVREVSIVIHKNFTKEALLEAIRKEILAIVPSHFDKNQRFIRVDWR